MATACKCKPLYSAVAKGIKQVSEEYVENYWKKKTGEEVDENKPLETLVKFIETQSKKDDRTDNSDKESIRQVLDIVAKNYMSTYYNMLLPQPVCKSFRKSLFHTLMKVRTFLN